MLTESVAFFLGISILFYCIFAGADFGAGMLECFPGKKAGKDLKPIITRAIGPVWEANHVWLVLAVVILFMGYPKVYQALSIRFHIPFFILLCGVILRGCAFTFRHYDAVQDRSQKYYTRIFELSSFLTPLMLGMIAGATVLDMKVGLGANFYEIYVSPWFNAFSFSVGVFTCILFSFLAAVYLIGETREKTLQAFFVRRAKLLNGLAVVSGVSVFLCAHLEGVELLDRFFDRKLSALCMGVATLLLLPLWMFLTKRSVYLARFTAGSQVAFILFGWFRLKFPSLLSEHTIYSAAAPDKTLVALLTALGVGSLLIFPALFYLLRIFKSEK